MKWLLLLMESAVLMYVYYRIAARYKLLDIPNERSSHTIPTLRGAGIVFVFTFIAGEITFNTYFPYLTAGLLIGSFVGFVDDIKNLRASIRASLYALAVGLTLMEIPGFTGTFGWYWLIVIGVIGVGTVNAYNFMDGINGITTLYSAGIAFSWIYFSYNLDGVDPHPVYFILIGLGIFGFLNLRHHALAFMGDSGSVGLGLMMLYLITTLCVVTGNVIYIALIMVYGVDSVITIVERLVKRENIFSAHRSHLYQVLSNQLKWSHLTVAFVYLGIQLLINLMIYMLPQKGFDHWSGLLIMALTSGLMYIIIKYFIVSPRVRTSEV